LSRAEPGTTDSGDLADLFLTHRNGLAGAVRGVLGGQADVREILQEAFLRAWRNRDRIPRDPLAWIFVVTLNVARDERRRLARRNPVLPGEDVDEAMIRSREPEPYANLERGEWLTRARQAIDRLEEHEREVFLLRVSGGLSFEQVATALEIPIGTAKTRMRAALGRLRQALWRDAPETAGRSMNDQAAADPNEPHPNEPDTNEAETWNAKD
jgi:RNA polymerase sigma factor (sigma-70 family)